MSENDLNQAKVGDRIYFEEEKAPYRVRARSERFIICTKPFNLRKTVFYTIVDLIELVRGPENLVFGFGAETDEQCEEMLGRLHGREELISLDDLRKLRVAIPDWKPSPPVQTEISHRNRIPVKIKKVKPQPRAEGVR